MKIAERINSLGTETAFAVSEEAAAFAALGNKVYPFHLGDLNFKTPAAIVKATLKAIEEGKTGYCPTRGITPLREALAADINIARGTHYTIDSVAIQPGGKPTIGKFVLALMNPGDEVLYPNPGYPIYESQIAFNGGVPVPYTFIEEGNKFRLDIEGLKRSITPRTRMLVINSPQNPTAAEYGREELEKLAALALKHDLLVLSDEAYFDIRYEGKTHSIASLPEMEERTIILYTFSKKFAMSGWRLGATIGPVDVINVVAKLNVNDESCSNHFIQYGALEGLRTSPPEVKQQLDVLKERRDVAYEILNSIPGIKCLLPQTTFYLFPNVTGLWERNGYNDYETFRKDILQNTGVSFCTRLHFGRPLEGERQRYIRLAYSGIDVSMIREGLGKMKEYLNQHVYA
ncbi:MAG: aminotransferase class I/II-fold pyridoxal phosphate-dependent enzyme [Bacteroidetes bacterium]|nr:aminotransferase class I/II-fold pyridoxal phosphate-dependent enzyme [Bacteroidota bacterium]MBS1979356.1 aminotransferase class I/II-fold pyridoxal phosphate-dependent enzyme [Bacteroidota bacterium]